MASGFKATVWANVRPCVQSASAMALWTAISALATSTPHSAHAQSSAATALPPPGWSTAEVETELARCAQLLHGLDIVAKPLPPLREHECGTPAPVALISVGKSPQVSFYPTVTVTCDLAAALAKWVKSEVQPLARKHLGAEVIRIDTMSSYSCRTAYGRKNARLSEHGKANAVDLRSFITAHGTTAEVLADWGPTGREITDQVAAAKKLDAGNGIAASRAPQVPATVATGSVTQRAAGPGLAQPTLAHQQPHNGAVTDGPAIGLSLPEPAGSGIGFSVGSGQTRLGGPKAGASPEIADLSPGSRTDFLRAAHDSACRVFGTTLGPEANSAHRNHFHVDMAERRSKGICE